MGLVIGFYMKEKKEIKLLNLSQLQKMEEEKFGGGLTKKDTQFYLDNNNKKYLIYNKNSSQDQLTKEPADGKTTKQFII